MKALLLPSVLIPWVLMIGAEILLFAQLVRHPGKTRYRCFECLVAVTLASSLVSITTAVLLTGRDYFYVYYLAETIKSLALVAACYEQFAVMFMPRWVMPARGQVTFVLALVMVVIAAACVAVYAPQHSPLIALAISRKMTAWENYAVFAALTILLQFRTYYGIQLRPKCRAVIYGLLSLTGMGMIENFILAFSLGRAASAVIGYFTTTIGFLVLLYWNQEFKQHELHLLLTDVDVQTVCLKKTPTSCGLTESYDRNRLISSGEQKANQCRL